MARDPTGGSCCHERLKRAQAALANSPVHDLRDLDVEEVEGALLISGRVDSFYHKQLAQEAVRFVVSDGLVVNRVRVTVEPR